MQISFENYPEINLRDRVAFSAIQVGARFATDRWYWEKIDEQNARVLDGFKSNSVRLLGQVHQFHSWSVVNSVSIT